MAIDNETCTIYTNLVDNINKAITDVLTAGQSYRIAGRELTKANLDELYDMLEKAIAGKTRFCTGSGSGAKVHRGVPLDT